MVMIIQVGGLSEGVYEYRFQVQSEELGLGERFAKDVLVEATLEKTGSQLFLQASIHAWGVFDCDRCVTPFETALNPSYRMYYVTTDEEYAQFDPAEVQALTPGMSTIDISDDVRQMIMLSVPLKLLCRNECAGLCQQCGKNLNEGSCECTTALNDSRWDPLRRLQSN